LVVEDSLLTEKYNITEILKNCILAKTAIGLINITVLVKFALEYCAVNNATASSRNNAVIQ
jgi:hypothetical protein